MSRPMVLIPEAKYNSMKEAIANDEKINNPTSPQEQIGNDGDGKDESGAGRAGRAVSDERGLPNVEQTVTDRKVTQTRDILDSVNKSDRPYEQSGQYQPIVSSNLWGGNSDTDDDADDDEDEDEAEDDDDDDEEELYKYAPPGRRVYKRKAERADSGPPAKKIRWLDY
jgi:hypothetical protein